MREQRFESGQAPRVTIPACSGDLVVQRWMPAAVQVSGEDFAAEETAVDDITLEGRSSLDVHLPAESRLVIGEVRGKITIKHLATSFEISSGLGDIQLRNTGGVDVGHVQGRLSADNLAGHLRVRQADQDILLRNTSSVTIEKAAGEVTIRFANGAVKLGRIGGAIQLHTISGDVTLARGGEDLTMSNLGGRVTVTDLVGTIRLLGGLADGEHRLNAAGDILVRWPLDAPLTLTATASQVRCLLPLAGMSESVSGETGRAILFGHIEEGKARLELATPTRIGLLPAVAYPARESELDGLDFDSMPLHDEGAPPESAPTLPSEEDRLRQSLIEAVISNLRPEEFGLDQSGLTQLVSAAVASGLKEAGVTPAVRQESSPASAPTSGQVRAEKARAAVEKSLAKLQESLEQARARAAGSAPPPQSAQTPSTAGSSPVPQMAKPERIATEEQRHILRLLQDGQITLEQAITLLNATGS